MLENLFAVCSHSDGYEAKALGYKIMLTGWQADDSGLLRPKTSASCAVLCASIRFSGPVDPSLPLLLADECAARGASGVFLEFGRAKPPADSAELAAGLVRRGLTVYSTSDIAGADYLFTDSDMPRLPPPPGRRRAAYIRGRRTETVISPGGAAEKHDISHGELAAWLQKHKPRVYVSGELNASYCTILEGAQRIFLVFDDDASIRARISKARSEGAEACFMLWSDIKTFLHSPRP